MSLSQSLQQRLLQKLSPQQIQLMKLLQVPTANLEERIKEEMEENPALEQGENDDDNFDEHKDDDSGSDDDYEMDGNEDDYGNVDISDYVADGDDEVGDYKLRDDNYPEIDDNKVIPYRVETTFHDMLADQLGMLKLNERDLRIAEQIVGSIDDDGYLRRETASIQDDLAFRQNIEVPVSEIENLISKIQQFDPAGVAARNLQECLLLQLHRQLKEGKNVKMAIDVLSDYFDEFTKKHYDKIQRGLGLTDEQLKDVINQIIKLNPKPGGNVGEVNKGESYVIPDFFVTNNNGSLEISLNSKNAPDLRISEGYRDMLRDYDRGSKKDKRQKEAVLFIKQKIDAAKWFIDAIKQRQNTLLSTMETILEYQYDFFLTGDETT
ncbi:MAG TPA: RNA polymerase sigma-54 factor, partial [Chitinophagaceae bacterium]|nr:RNA polymerase sigma-54 factor [Chitinophagaceae bacterium]